MPHHAAGFVGQYFDFGIVSVAAGRVPKPWRSFAFCQLQLCVYRIGQRFLQYRLCTMAADCVVMDVFLSNVLASSGSMGGGIKNVRALVLFKFSLREMLILLHPRAVRTVKVNNRSIPDRMALTVMSFIFIYFMTVIVFSFLLMAAGLDFFIRLYGSHCLYYQCRAGFGCSWSVA